MGTLVGTLVVTLPGGAGEGRGAPPGGSTGHGRGCSLAHVPGGTPGHLTWTGGTGHFGEGHLALWESRSSELYTGVESKSSSRTK